MSEIYCIENKVNGKQYIGKTRHTHLKRWQGHLYDVGYGSNTKIHNAIRKYGPENFTVFPLEECSEDVLDLREQYWIAIISPEYNMTDGGEGGVTWQGKVKKTWKVKDTSKMKGPKTITEKKLNGYKQISGSKNYQFKGFIKTPWGVFESISAAVSANNSMISDTGTLRNYLNNIDTPLNKEGRRTRPDWRGKTPKEIGFGIESKD